MLKTPPLQTATATIDTLCGRLESATLLEDRRAAIQGLRSFAKQYPASVASGSLRELIATLKRDGLGEAASTKGQDREGPEGGDVDTIRLVLETLLMLFNPDSNSPEAGDEIAFFLADEFAMVCTVARDRHAIDARAKLMPAPRQHNPPAVSARSHQSDRRLLFAQTLPRHSVCHMCCPARAIAGMYTFSTIGYIAFSGSAGRWKRCCAKRWLATAG